MCTYSRNEMVFDFLQLTKKFQAISNLSSVTEKPVDKKTEIFGKIAVQNFASNKPFLNCYFSPANCRLPSKPMQVDLLNL